jgi:hypothetical protein
MPTIQIETDQLLQAALQMPREELETFVIRLFTLKASEETQCLSDRETELLLAINQVLPAATRKRLNKLIKKRQSYTITEAELRELRQLTDQIEKSDAERLKNLIELAHLRQVTLGDLIRQLGLKPYPHD